MRVPIIKNGKVINIIEVEEGQEIELDEDLEIGADGGNIGDTVKNGEYIRIETETYKASPLDILKNLDAKLTRSEEDIIDALIITNTLKLSDLSNALIQTYTRKQSAREQLNDVIILDVDR